jgi:hypothetical protein
VRPARSLTSFGGAGIVVFLVVICTVKVKVKAKGLHLYNTYLTSVKALYNIIF